jgi:hypothetical protein
MELIRIRTERQKQLRSNDGLETKKEGLVAGFPRQFDTGIES